MSTAAKVAIATTAGAVAATAAGFAASEQGRKLRQKVSRKVRELVDQGSITLKNTPMREVVQEFETLLSGFLGGGQRGRMEQSSRRGGMAEDQGPASMRSRSSSGRMARRGRRLSQGS